MSLQKKSIFSENKLALQTLTPTYSKFNCQPLTETSQQSNVFFFKDSLSQNSKFLKNFKSKHLNIATPTVNSFIDTTGSREIPIHPFRLNDIQESELSDRNIAKIMKHNDVIAFKNKAKDTNSDTNPFSFEMIETLEDQNPHKTTNKANAPFYKSLSPSKVYKTLKLQNKENKCLIDSVDLNGVKEKNSKIMKMSLRKKSEVFECDENEKEEFSASKNLLHSSVYRLFYFISNYFIFIRDLIK